MNVMDVIVHNLLIVFRSIPQSMYLSVYGGLRYFPAINWAIFNPLNFPHFFSQELRNAEHEMQRMTSQWYSEVRESPDTSDIEIDFQEPSTSSTKTKF